MKMTFHKKLMKRHQKSKKRCCHDREPPCINSSLSCFGIFMQMQDQNPVHMDECLSSLLFSEKSEMEGGKKLPYSIINDLSGDRKCSATKRNNQSALKITSKYSLLAFRSPGAIPSPLWGLVRNVPINLGWIILGQSCQNTGNARWKGHSCRLTLLNSSICIYEETKGPV